MEQIRMFCVYKLRRCNYLNVYYVNRIVPMSALDTSGKTKKMASHRREEKRLPYSL